MHELKTSPEWQSSVVAVASRTDEPSWALECMRKFVVSPAGSAEEVCIMDCIDERANEINKGNKRGHLQRISDATGVPLDEMLFFDNERDNLIDVAPMGVTCAWVPEGVTAAAWASSLERFPSPGEILDFRRGG